MNRVICNKKVHFVNDIHIDISSTTIRENTDKLDKISLGISYNFI